MPTTDSPPRSPVSCRPRPPLALLLAAALSLAAQPSWAEKGDRLKPLNISSDNGGSIEIAKQRTEFNGNVVLSKGSMVLRAERLDLRETPDGFYQAYANGQTGKQVSFRQARDVAGEVIEGFADQLEYDTRSDTVRFIGNATVRRLQGTAVADEVTGAVILFDNRSEVFTLESGQSSPHPSGRVRVVMMPRGAAAAPEAATPPEAAASGISLQPSTILNPRKPS